MGDTGEEDQLLKSFRKIKNGELRGSILKLVGNANKRAKCVPSSFSGPVNLYKRN